MKRKLKILAIISILAICGILMSSCEYIDEMRNIHAVYIYDNGETKLQKNGKMYVEIENFEKYYNLMEPTPLRVTEKDVPVLLINEYGDFGAYYAAGDIIKIDEKLYCVEDKYEQYVNYADGNIVDMIVVEVYDKDKLRTVNQEFTESEKELILSIWNEENKGEFVSRDSDWINYHKRINLRICDSSKSVFRKNNVFMTYSKKNDAYGVVVENYNSDSDIIKYMYTLYPVPDDKREAFESLIGKYYFLKSKYYAAS